jgi:hypothetical protein
MDLRKTHTIVLNQGEPEEKRAEILEFFHATYDLDEKLYETLKEEGSFYLRADRLRHPLIFYFGHTAAFFVNKLIIARVIEDRINPRFESMFAVGVDEMSWDDLDSHPAAHPPHHLGESLVGDRDGDRARADSPGDVIGADPPVATGPGETDEVLGDLPGERGAAGERAAAGPRRNGGAGQA